jgi:hypothetical protein
MNEIHLTYEQLFTYIDNYIGDIICICMVGGNVTQYGVLLENPDRNVLHSFPNSPRQGVLKLRTIGRQKTFLFGVYPTDTFKIFSYSEKLEKNIAASIGLE